MDLSKLNLNELANKGSVMELLHPTNGEVLTDEKGKEPKPFYFRLLGSDSDVYRKSLQRQLEAANKKKKGGGLDLEDAERKLAERCAKCVVDCYLIEDGKPVESTYEEMVRVFIKYSWIREQVDKHITDRAALMNG